MISINNSNNKNFHLISRGENANNLNSKEILTRKTGGNSSFKCFI